MEGFLCEIEPPNEKQKQFFLARQRFVAYGGARGGGKSWAVRRKALLLALNYPGIRMLLLRRSLTELRENHLLALERETQKVAEYKTGQSAFLFHNGSRLRFGYCDGEGGLLQYQGQEYDVIFIDEATQFTELQFLTLTACLRGTNQFPKRIYLTCNPGGVGHEWVKRLFIKREYRATEHAEEYAFIPAKVWDNPALMERDQGYLAMLENLPADLRRAWLDGDWECFAGQYFTEFREEVHLVEPFSLPEHWRRYFAMDYGLDMLAGYWIAVDEVGYAYVYREMYESNLIISQAAERIKENTMERIFAYFAPPDLWNRRQETGKSLAEIFAEHGIVLTKAQNDRVQGWLNLKEWLKPVCVDGVTTAALRIFRGCEHLIRSLPALQFDRLNPNDCAGEPHEYTHAPDALRYFVAGRPIPATEKRQKGRAIYEAQMIEMLSFGR